MRDPKRIDVILQEISTIWHKYPDMRLGQLIGNVLEGPSLYYVEDDSLVKALKDVYEGAKEPVEFDDEAYIFDLIKKLCSIFIPVKDEEMFSYISCLFFDES